MKRLRVSILGASGYSGGELMRLLRSHPHVDLVHAVAATHAGSRVIELHPWCTDDALRFSAYTPGLLEDTDVVFLALPHGEAMTLAPELMAAGKLVIDLSGDHRLKDRELFERYYGRPQCSPEALLMGAVYGAPEWTAQELRGQHTEGKGMLIANPGCYATSANLALAPLLAEGLIEPNGIVITAMSGVSGAGRKAAIEYSFTEVNENVKAYRVGDHQHTPEIEMLLSRVAGAPVAVTFVPQLIPITRGIYTTCVATARAGASAQTVRAAFERHYAEAPFVRFDADRMPEIKRVTGTNYLDVTARFVPERDQVITISTIDNLLKGAAGQAVQNMNLACGFAEREGLH